MENFDTDLVQKGCINISRPVCRQRLGEEYKKQCSAILTQWEADLEKTKAEEEELQALLKQKQKLLQQRRAQQTQHLNTIRKLHQQFMKVGDSYSYNRF